MKKLLLILPFLWSCSTSTCIKNQNSPSGDQKMTSPSSKADHVKIYKPDGSLQCGQGKKIALDDMEKELEGIKVYNKENKNDGLMRIQMCGTPTGYNNVYEIDKMDLEKALKKGFKEWTFE